MKMLLQALPIKNVDNGDGSSILMVANGAAKAGVTTAHNLIEVTTTGAEIDCTNYNAILVETNITVAAKNWTIKVQGCLTTGGTFVDLYDATTLMSYQTNSSKLVLWKGIPNFIKIVATEDEDGGKCTVRVQPLTI